MTLSKETIELIKTMAEERASLIHDKYSNLTSIGIESTKWDNRCHNYEQGMVRALTDPDIIASVKGDEWVNVEDATPTAYHTGNFDGKKSDPVLAEIEFGVYKIGVVYEGYMDGRHFVQWYDENDFEIKTPKRWRNIPL